LRKLTAAICRSRCVMIFINQIREKIGMGYGTGPMETTPGGRALKFYSSVRIDVRRIAGIKSGEVTIGSRIRATVSKNKVAPPFRRSEFEILFDRGITHEGALLALGVKFAVITKAGSWYSFGETRLGQGFEKVIEFFLANKDVAEAVEKEIRLHAKSPLPGAPGPAPMVYEAGETPAEETAGESA
jgi:recombination protein RecA